MITVGVTGGIGSGKTTVCKEWEKLGAKVIYADDLAKELMVHDHELRKKLITTFGEDTYHQDGTLNRAHLIRHAFEGERVKELNEIVHPAVASKFKEISKKAEQDGEKMLVEEAALLLNKGRPSFLDIIVIVMSERTNRLKRVIRRDSVSEEKILERDQKQPDFESLVHLADYVVENNGTLENLKKRSIELYLTILKKYSDNE